MSFHMLLKRWKRLFYSLLHYFRHIFHGLLLLKVWRVRTTQLFGGSSSLWNACFSLKRFLWTQPAHKACLHQEMDVRSVIFCLVFHIWLLFGLFCSPCLSFESFLPISHLHGLNYFLKPWYNELSRHKN